MTDPRRWTDEHADATALERDLVQAGHEVRLPDAQKRELWASIALQCPKPVGLEAAEGGIGAAEAGVAASAVTSSALVKTLVVVAVAGGLASTGYVMLRDRPVTPSAAPSSDPTAAVATPSATRVSVSEAAPETHAPQAAAAPSAQRGARGTDPRPASIGAPDPSARASQLREESRITLLARRQLRSGDPQGALRLLEQARVRFPDGALGQEREALTIEALAKSGSGKAAERRARDFLRENPRSPHAADVRAYRKR